MLDDTICAIATSVGNSGISIIRISGKDSFNLVQKITPKLDILKLPANSINYTKIIYNNEVIDEVLLSKFCAPKSYTNEDVIEINCHGGISSTNKIMEILLEIGIRQAQPGEFTKRAFLNGRIDLVEAEAINDLIKSQNDLARKLAINKIEGNLSVTINNIRTKLVEIITNIEANIDYPEYEDIEILTNEKIKEPLIKINEQLSNLLKESNNGKIINNGVNVALIGKPNVGKSSILNKLLGENKAIVTDIAGTTRDIVEGSIILNNVQFNLIDTAGLRKTKDVVEKIGVEKSLQILNQADVVILILNNNEEITEEELDLINKLKEKNLIIFINKNDLEKKLLIKLSNTKIISGNTINHTGLENLKTELINMYNYGNIELKDLNYITNNRQINLIKNAKKSIANALQAINQNLEIDLVTIDITNAWKELGKIIGQTYEEDLLDELFSRFCLGK